MISETYDMTGKFNNEGSGEWTQARMLTIDDFIEDFQTKIVITIEDAMRADFGDIRFYD